jgi:hypothetical protein
MPVFAMQVAAETFAALVVLTYKSRFELHALDLQSSSVVCDSSRASIAAIRGKPIAVSWCYADDFRFS